MRKLMILLFALIFIVACSSDDGTATESAQADDDHNESEESNVSRESLYSYEHEDALDYSLLGLQTDADAKGIIFTEREDIDRVTDRYSYFVNHNDEVIDVLSLANDPDQERRCTDMNFSPNGKYMVYNCHDDGIEFSIYDLEEEAIIFQVDESDLYVQNIVGISDDLTVYLETVNDDRQNQFTLYDAESESHEHFVLDELLNLEQVVFNAIMPTDDGTKVFFDAVVALFILDLETGDVNEVVHLESLWDSLGDDDIFIYNARLSPDGKYLYYHISDNSNDVDYDEHVLHHLETDEVESYAEFEYESVRNFDLHGNLLLVGDSNLYLYNFEDKETRVIPDISFGRHGRYITLASNGAFLVYTDKDQNEDDSYTQYLYRVSLGDINTYETTNLNVTEMVAGDVDVPDELEENETTEQDDIAFHHASLDESDVFYELWESTTETMFPTEFPEDIDYVHRSLYGDIPGRRFVHTIYLDRGIGANQDQVTFSATFLEEEDSCFALRDLDVVKTVDGVDYYFYDYRNADVEAGVVIDNICYFIESEDYTEDEMLSMIESLQPIESVFYDLPIDGFKFPTELPIADPTTGYASLRSTRNGEEFSYSLSYLGDGDHQLNTTISRSNHAPNSYQNENRGFAVDVVGWDEAYFSELNKALQLFDGTYYYDIELGRYDELVEELGIDEFVDIHIRIGESIQ